MNKKNPPRDADMHNIDGVWIYDISYSNDCPGAARVEKIWPGGSSIQKMKHFIEETWDGEVGEWRHPRPYFYEATVLKGAVTVNLWFGHFDELLR